MTWSLQIIQKTSHHHTPESIVLKGPSECPQREVCKSAAGAFSASTQDVELTSMRTFWGNKLLNCPHVFYQKVSTQVVSIHQKLQLWAYPLWSWHILVFSKTCVRMLRSSQSQKDGKGQDILLKLLRRLAFTNDHPSIPIKALQIMGLCSSLLVITVHWWAHLQVSKDGCIAVL